MYARTASVRIVKRDSTRSISYKTHPRKESKRNFKMHVRLLLSYSEISRNAWLSLIGCLLLYILRVIVEECNRSHLFADLSYSVFSVLQQFLELAYIEETTGEELLPRQGNRQPTYVSEGNNLYKIVNTSFLSDTH